MPDSGIDKLKKWLLLCSDKLNLETEYPFISIRQNIKLK